MKRLREAGVALLLTLHALLPAARAQVQASLVSSVSAVAPGRPFTVALRLIHAPHWHTYWLNPGTGLATTLDWKLPEGWKAGPIDWPAPGVLTDDKGNVTGSGFDGDLLLPVTLTPPANLAAGGSVALSALADWLMCSDVCKPGEATVALTLPVTSETPAPDRDWSPRIKSVLDRLPRADAAWSLSATREGKFILLHINPSPSSQSAVFPKGVHFFGDDSLVAYEQPQDVVPDSGGGAVIKLAISPDAPGDSGRLLGVLTASEGWAGGGAEPGIRVDIPLGGGATSAPASGGGGLGGGTSAGVSGVSAAATGGLGATLFLAFAGGLILNLMPCVFPVLGIKVLGFVNQAGSERRKVALHGLVFTSGVVLSFWVLVAVLTVLRAGGQQLGWGFQLQSPAFIFCLAAGLLVFALNLSGVFEFGLSATAVGSGLQTKGGLGGSFFTGVLATVVATPCSAPFLAPALGAALTLSTGESFLVFTVIAIGLSTPYLLLSLFPSAVRVLPRPGAWMETFKELMAFPLYATVGYLLWVLAGQASESGLLSAFFGLVLVAMGVWAYGKWHSPVSAPGRARAVSAIALALLGLGLWSGWPSAAAPTEIVWEKWSPDAVEKLRAKGKIVYVDFTARWCATCQANKRVVFHSDDVLSSFRQNQIVTLRGDWTNRDPAISAELARYNRSAVPFNLVWLPGKSEPVILPEILTPGVVLKAVNQKG